MGVTMHDTTRRRGSAEVQTLGGPAELLWPRSSHLTKSARGRIEIQFSAELWRDILYEHLYTTCIRPQKKKDWKYICGVYFWVWDLMAILLNVKKKTFYFPHILFSSVQFSRSVASDSLQPYGLQHARFPCPSPNPGAYSNSCPSSWWYHPAISSSVITFSSCLHLSRHQGLNESAPCIKWPKYWSFSFSMNISIRNTQDWSPLGGLVGSLCSPRDSQESSLTPQFKSINSSALSFLYSPTLTSIHDH